MRCLREAGPDGSSAASYDPPSLLPLNVHNHAYLRLLRWDHASDPFPEVNAVDPVASHCVSLLVKYLSLCIMSLVVLLCRFLPSLTLLLFILLSIDSVDGPGSVPGDAAGDRAVSSALLCASRRLHYHRRGYLRPARADGNS